MYRNYCFRRKRHSYAACDAALAASLLYIFQNLKLPLPKELVFSDFMTPLHTEAGKFDQELRKISTTNLVLIRMVKITVSSTRMLDLTLLITA